MKTVTSAEGTTTYTYDLVGQVTGVALPGGRTISYSYDVEENRTVVADAAAGTDSYATNNADQYTAAGGETLTYDRVGRVLTSTKGGVTTSYSYDANGQLASITSPGSVTTLDLTPDLTDDGIDNPDAFLDLSTFRFANFGWGAFKLDAPAEFDGTSFHTVVDATEALGVLVQIDAELNTANGLFEVVFTSLDPATNEVPTDPFLGFLPPDNGAGAGDGFINYTVAPEAGLPSGTVFTALASIVFDTENPIATPTVTNTLDIVAPTSQLTAFAGGTTARSTFAVRWTAADNAGGSGLSGTTIFFTDTFNGVESELQSLTLDDLTSAARFTGEAGHTYKFFSAAIDAVGNVEELAAFPDATITVVPPNFVEVGKKKTFTDADGDLITLKYKGRGSAKIALVGGGETGAIDFLQIEDSTTKSKLKIAVKRVGEGDGEVGIGDVTINGSFGALSAKKSDLVFNGLVATGTVKSIAVDDLVRTDALLADPQITLGGTNTDSTKISAGVLADGFTLNTPGVVSKLTAADIGEGVILAIAIKQLEIKMGDLNADIALAETLGTILLKQGSIADATITAGGVGAVKIAQNLTNTLLLAGADLGVDRVLGGTGSSADTFAAGSIGGIKIGGAVTGSTIGAGLSTTNAVLHDEDDTIIGGDASRIAKLIVKGAASADSYFAAGRFVKTPKINGAAVDPASDPRFLVA